MEGEKWSTAVSHIKPLQTAVSLCSQFLDYHPFAPCSHCNIMQQKLLVQPIVYTGAKDLELERKKKTNLVSKLCSSLNNGFSCPEFPSICPGSLSNLESHFGRNHNHFGLPHRPLHSCWCDSRVWRSSSSEDQSQVHLVQYRPIWRDSFRFIEGWCKVTLITDCWVLDAAPSALTTSGVWS